MANSAQARKRARQADVRHLHNQGQRSHTRTHVKKVVNAIAEGNKEAATEAYKEAVPVIDRSVNQGMLHKNKAARHKSRLNAQIKAM
ncbi:MAG: 30S ribosomal protein S20 [Pseudomonadota bacterium]